MLKWILFAAIAATQPQVGGPAYLNCTLSVGGKPQLASLMLDEANQRASIEFGSADAGRVATAIFSPGEVKIADKFYTWTIDRVSLEVQRIAIIGEKHWAEAGTCQIAKVPANRAF